MNKVCEYKNCPNLISTNFSCCLIHQCFCDGCPNTIFPISNSSHCEEHLIFYRSYKLICASFDCGNFIVDNTYKHCWKHICRHIGCDENACNYIQKRYKDKACIYHFINKELVIFINKTNNSLLLDLEPP